MSETQTRRIILGVIVGDKADSLPSILACIYLSHGVKNYDTILSDLYTEAIA